MQVLRDCKWTLKICAKFCSDLCKPGTLDPKKVKGKILICLRGDNPRVDKGQNAALAGAVGMVLANDESNENDVTADPHVLPASHITYKDGQTLYAYMKSTKYAQPSL